MVEGLNTLKMFTSNRTEINESVNTLLNNPLLKTFGEMGVIKKVIYLALASGASGYIITRIIKDLKNMFKSVRREAEGYATIRKILRDNGIDPNEFDLEKVDQQKYKTIFKNFVARSKIDPETEFFLRINQALD